MTYNVLMGTLNPTHSLIHSLTRSLAHSLIDILGLQQQDCQRNTKSLSRKWNRNTNGSQI